MSQRHHANRISVPGSQSYAARRPILVTPKRKPERVVVLYNESGENVTPKPLNPDIFAGRERQISVHEFSERADISRMSENSAMYLSKSQSTVKFKHDLDKQGAAISVQYKGSLQSSASDAYLDIFVADEDGRTDDASIGTTGGAKALFKMKKTPTSISLILSETSTFFLLDLTSCTELKDTDEGTLVEQDNERYEYLTVGKGKHRKIVQAEVQTMPMVLKTRNTSYEKTKTQVGSAFVSVYDMYDTFQVAKEDSEAEEDESADEIEDGNVKLDDSGSVESFKLSLDEKCMSKLMKNAKFLEACIVMERLLANNCYNEQQKVFIGLSDPDPFRENIQYKYRLKLLWTFANTDTTGRSVNSCDWNPQNRDILAVGYGKFYFHDNITGLVLIWNIKNPVQPERKYVFPKPVTALQFSRGTPVLLAVGFYNGSVKVLNISSRETMIIGENVPTFEPCWNIIWQYGRNERKNEELVTVTFDDGRICAYSVQRKLEMSQLMRVGKADGKLKGYDAMKKCTNLTIPVSRYSSALIVRLHPLDPSIYFVGTNEGTIHKCSLNYLSQHLDVFLAHEGSVHELKFSPFFKQIFATCGDDWHTRIWAEGIPEPVLTISGMQSVQGLDWSPTHSTILVVIRAQNIEVWDVQRKVYGAQSITPSPTGTRNTVVQFTESGRCLIVGDTDGDVHVFSLEDMPFIPFFQENLLSDSLARVLVTNPQVLANIRKLRRASKEHRMT